MPKCGHDVRHAMRLLTIDCLAMRALMSVDFHLSAGRQESRWVLLPQQAVPLEVASELTMVSNLPWLLLQSRKPIKAANPLKLLVHPTSFELITSAFGGL